MERRWGWKRKHLDPWRIESVDNKVNTTSQDSCIFDNFDSGVTISQEIYQGSFILLDAREQGKHAQ